MGVSEIQHTSRLGVAEPELHIHAKTLVVIVAVCVIYFAGLVGVVGSGFFTRTVGEAFQSPAQSTWLAPIVTIMTAVLNLPLSQAADFWGRKWILVITTLLGFVGSILISRANGISMVIAGYVLLGASYGSLSSLFAVISEVVPRKQRPVAQGAANAAAGVGAVTGLLVGAALILHGNVQNYRVYYYINAGLFFAGAVGCAIAYNPLPRDLQVSLTHIEKLRRLDWIGYLLFAPGLVLFCMALTWSDNPYSWKDAHILAPFIVGLGLMVAFVLYEWLLKKDGILHHDLFTSRNFNIAIATSFSEGASFFTTNSYFAFEVSTLTGANVLMSSTRFSIVFISTAVFSIMAGLYSEKKKTIRQPLVAGFLALMLFNVVMAISKPSTPDTTFWCLPLLAGLGLGTILPIAVVAAQLSTPPEHIALASGLVVSARAFGASVALAINNAIFSSSLSSHLVSEIAAATLSLGLPSTSLEAFIQSLTSSNSEALDKIPGVTPKIIGAAVAAMKKAYSIAFRNVWIAAGCFAFVALIGSFFFQDPRSEFNNHIDAPAEEELVHIQEDFERGYPVECETAHVEEVSDKHIS